MAETLYVEGSGDECDVRLDTWLRDLLARTPGVVRQVAKRETLLAIREFYEQSYAWRVVIGPKTVVANKARYTLSPYDAYANVVAVLSAEFNEVGMTALPRRPAGREPDGTAPWAYFTESPDILRLWPTPTVEYAEALTIYVALTPKITVTHVPRIAATRHYDAILDGALGRIMSQPAKPYSNQVLGQYHLNRFRAAIGKYKAAAIQGNNGAPAWSFPRFGK